MAGTSPGVDAGPGRARTCGLRWTPRRHVVLRLVASPGLPDRVADRACCGRPPGGAGRRCTAFGRLPACPRCAAGPGGAVGPVAGRVEVAAGPRPPRAAAARRQPRLPRRGAGSASATRDAACADQRVAARTGAGRAGELAGSRGATCTASTAGGRDELRCDRLLGQRWLAPAAPGTRPGRPARHLHGAGRGAELPASALSAVAVVPRGAKR